MDLEADDSISITQNHFSGLDSEPVHPNPQ